MGDKSFQYFGKIAQRSDDNYRISGRTKKMANGQEKAIKDIIIKLSLSNNDNLLDIGCGPGNLLMPLSKIVNSATGIDHINCLETLKNTHKINKNISLVPGNFLDIEINQTYEKILCYSVIQYLSDEKELFIFINKALNLLKHGGKLLIGDLPNLSRKKRFMNSDFGHNYDRKYRNNKTEDESELSNTILLEDHNLVVIDDNLILKILKKTRQNGFNSFLLDQDPDLCLGYTREDILITKFLK